MARPRKDANEGEYKVTRIPVKSQWFVNGSENGTTCYLNSEPCFDHAHTKAEHAFLSQVASLQD